MDADTLYKEYLSGDSAALESLMEIYGDKLTLISTDLSRIFMRRRIL